VGLALLLLIGDPGPDALDERPRRGVLSGLLSAPTTVNWSGLSPLGREARGQIGMRLSAGYSTQEIALLIDSQRDELEWLVPPRRGPITDQWVTLRLRDLR